MNTESFENIGKLMDQLIPFEKRDRSMCNPNENASISETVEWFYSDWCKGQDDYEVIKKLSMALKYNTPLVTAALISKEEFCKQVKIQVDNSLKLLMDGMEKYDGH